MRQRRLRIKVDGKNPVAVKRGGMGEVQGHRRLARAALEIRDSRPDRALACRPLRQKAAPANAQAASQFVDFVQRKPPLPPVLLNNALGQGGIRRQTPPQGGLVHTQDQLGQLPGREPPQGLFVLR